MALRGRPSLHLRRPPAYLRALASYADQFLIPLPFEAERPLEEGL